MVDNHRIRFRKLVDGDAAEFGEIGVGGVAGEEGV
jgi:hypothetical protein